MKERPLAEHSDGSLPRSAAGAAESPDASVWPLRSPRVRAPSCSSDRRAASSPDAEGGVPPASRPPIESIGMIGDSITVGAEQALRESFAELGPFVASIDAENGRRMRTSSQARTSSFKLRRRSRSTSTCAMPSRRAQLDARRRPLSRSFPWMSSRLGRGSLGRSCMGEVGGDGPAGLRRYQVRPDERSATTHSHRRCPTVVASDRRHARQTAAMPFGQQSGPPATSRQVQELLALLQAAGHDGFRDARGPMGLTQRQAGGKFTRDEADGLIARLQEGADGGEVAPAEPTPRRSAVEQTLRAVPTERLAAELQRRGWVVLEP